jgi:hypothetical protein
MASKAIKISSAMVAAGVRTLRASGRLFGELSADELVVRRVLEDADAARDNAEKATGEEIEVTEEMIRAGMDELYCYSPESGSARDSAEDIYRAMERAKRLASRDNSRPQR